MRPMTLGENIHKRPQGSHKIHYIKNFELNLNSFSGFFTNFALGLGSYMPLTLFGLII